MLQHHSATRATLVLFTCFFIFNTNLMGQCPALVWSDEFSGTTLDAGKWTAETGGGGWGNSELQYYKAANATVSGGTLKITAKKEKVQANNYTSARIKTYLKGDWTYGRFEARIKLPKGAGLWPAFWMMPTDSYYGTWPKSGEMDISELIGSKPTNSFGTLHYGTSSTDHQYKSANFFLNSGTYADAFHTFAIEWQAGVIRWFVDDNLYSTITAADISPYAWPFDKRFYIILNLAVGGTLGGTVDNTIFPATMEVDYVRVYGGNTPTVSGNRVVLNQAQGETYKVTDAPSGSTYAWTVPSGASIASGQGTNTIKVNWANTSSSGNVSCTVTSSCSTSILAMNVYVEPAYNYGFSFVNFDTPGQATYSRSDGTYSTIANPSPTGLNTSALSGKYTRNNTVQYDYILYNTSAITNAADYKTKAKKFYIDVYTAAPVGTPILIQLENGSTATSTNYPTGRNSRYIAYTTKQNQWERLIFSWLDTPDPATSDASVNHLLVMINSNTFSGDTYYIDNLDSYTAGTPTLVNASAITIERGNNSTIQVYPNPAANEVRLTNMKPNSTVTIFNTTGQLMGSYSFANPEHAIIKISNLAAGNYYIKVTTATGIESYKMIKH